MKIKFTIVFVLMMNGIAFSGEKELFPLDQLKVGMSVEEFKQVYPEAKWSLEKKDDSDQLIEAMVSQPIVGNRFWNAALIFFHSAKVSTYTYCRVMEWESSKENVPEIYRQLVQHFGMEPEKNTAKSDMVEDEKMPVYLWKANDLIYAFSHTPFAQYQKGEMFSSFVRIIRPDMLTKYSLDVSDYDEKDAELFKDLRGVAAAKETKSPYGLIVIGGLGIMIVVAAIVYKHKEKPKAVTKK